MEKSQVILWLFIESEQGVGESDSSTNAPVPPVLATSDIQREKGKFNSSILWSCDPLKVT
jgi:hypothetical protein